ncbi:hypothetical protein D7X33_39700, partial [Butyricicoccus sp. 1XD8-22]
IWNYWFYGKLCRFYKFGEQSLFHHGVFRLCVNRCGIFVMDKKEMKPESLQLAFRFFIFLGTFCSYESLNSGEASKLIEKGISMDQIWQSLMMPNTLVQIPQGQSIVSYKVGDVTGNHFPDFIYLTGTKQADSPSFLKDITLYIKYGRSNYIQKHTLSENMGFHPTIWLGDFTGDGID